MTSAKRILLGLCLLLPLSFKPAKADLLDHPALIIGGLAALVALPVLAVGGYYWYKQHKLAKRSNAEVLSEAKQFYSEVFTRAKSYADTLGQITPELKELEKKALEQELLKTAMTSNSARYALIVFEEKYREHIADLMQHNRWLRERIDRVKMAIQPSQLGDESFLKDAEQYIKDAEELAGKLSKLCDIIVSSAQYMHEKHMKELDAIRAAHMHPVIYYHH